MNPNPSPLRRLALVGAAASFMLAACGSDDDPAAESASTDAAAATTTADSMAPATTAATAATDAGSTVPATTTAGSMAPATTTGEEADGGLPPADESAFPLTIEHKFGETTIDALPERVVSVGFAEHDSLLAIGVEPIAVREWYGEYPYATWPWAQDELGDLEPQVLSADETNFEEIAALDPDLIIGQNSGMTDTQYATLSEIAPTVAQSGEYADFAMPWRDALAVAGRATGRSAAAEQVLAETEAKLAAVREAHPEFDGLEATVGFVHEGQPGAYPSTDIRAAILEEFGFVTPPEYDELTGDTFFFQVSGEELAKLDTDVIVWIAGDELAADAIRDLSLRPTLTAYQEGREVFADELLSGAFSHGNPLSLDYVIEHLVPDLAAAVDGDPATEPPSSNPDAADVPATTTGNGDAAAGIDGAEAEAAAAAWASAFDSTIGFDDKAAHIADADALKATIESYTEAGSAMGGISLKPTAATVDGDAATITYDVYFGDASQYQGLEGTIELVDGTWVVGRDEFCSFMAQARNACPA